MTAIQMCDSHIKALLTVTPICFTDSTKRSNYVLIKGGTVECENPGRVNRHPRHSKKLSLELKSTEKSQIRANLPTESGKFSILSLVYFDKQFIELVDRFEWVI